MRFYEFKSYPAKPLTLGQARIKALKDQAKRAQAAVKLEKNKQRIAKSQNEIQKLLRTSSK